MSASRESVGVPAVESPAAGFVRRQPVISGMLCRRGDVTVTTIDAAAAQRRHPRMALAVLMALAGFGLAGCETSASLFGWNSPPAQETTAATPVPAAMPPLARVSVAPIVGAPDAIAKQIQQEFTSAVEKQRISVTASKDERADYTLRGYIVAAKDKAATRYRHQGILHLGCHRSVRQARQPHHRRGSHLRQCHQATLGPR